MRIIAGTHRACLFQGPDDETTTRPVTDRAKETLFNRLYSLGMFSVEDEAGNPTPFNAADVFSGTGSMGLECLSRGASSTLFVEQDKRIREILEANLKGLKFEPGRSRILSSSALSTVWIDALPPATRLVFLDPPYKMVEEGGQKDQLLALFPALLTKMEEGGIVVFRTPRGVDLPDIGGFDMVSFHVGTMTFYFYQKPMA